LRSGLFGWIFGRLVIQRVFERLVEAHVVQLADAATSNPLSNQPPVDPA